MTTQKLNLVVAACNNNGIGINGNLPWKLRKDMDFFKAITSTTKDPDKKNAVIMGRKTYFSIPEKFRPLRNRVNIVLSRELKELPEGVYLARSLPDALSLVSSSELSEKIEDLHIIGGSSVYKEALEGPYPCRLYLTRILADFDCDTFLPEISDEKFTKIPNPDNVPAELMEENGIKFRMEVYEKKVLEQQKVNQDVGEYGDCRQIIAKDFTTPDTEQKTSMSGGKGPMKFDLMVAMCHGNRGIGYKMELPWPRLQKDIEYYRSVTTTQQKDFNGMIIQIHGRLSWNGCPESQRSCPNVYHIVVSRTLDPSAEKHPHLLIINQSFQESLDYCNSPERRGQIDSIWIMGGVNLYKEAMTHPWCNRLYMTHVYKDFPADVIFPPFEHMFKEIRNDVIDQTKYEEHGIMFEMKVYEKIIS